MMILHSLGTFCREYCCYNKNNWFHFIPGYMSQTNFPDTVVRQQDTTSNLAFAIDVNKLRLKYGLQWKGFCFIMHTLVLENKYSLFDGFNTQLPCAAGHKLRCTNILWDSTFERLSQSPEWMGSRNQAPDRGTGGWSPWKHLGFCHIQGPKSALWGPLLFLMIFSPLSYFFFAVSDFFRGVALPCSCGFRSPVVLNSSCIHSFPITVWPFFLLSTIHNSQGALWHCLVLILILAYKFETP